MKSSPVVPTTPLSPDQLPEFLSARRIPPEVIKAFNQLIIDRWDGRRAVVKQEDVVKTARALLGDRAGGFVTGWLDVEPLFQAEGWSVQYDKPGYNESYPATFTFTPNK